MTTGAATATTTTMRPRRDPRRAGPSPSAGAAESAGAPEVSTVTTPGSPAGTGSVQLRERASRRARERAWPERPGRRPRAGVMVTLLDDLEARGLVHDSTDRDQLAQRLAAGPMSLYYGCDPSADSLHVGNLIGLLVLRRFQDAGHRPVALAGG